MKRTQRLHSQGEWQHVDSMDGTDEETFDKCADEGDPDESVFGRLVKSHRNKQNKAKFVTVRLILAAVLASLGGVVFGYDVGIVSGALLQLSREFALTCRQQEMVVSALLLGALGASLTGGFLVDYIGRRASIITNAGIFIVGALILSCAQDFSTLIGGRIVVGFAVALSAIAECVYISEIAPPNLRGMLVSLNELGVTVGFLIAYLINFEFINTPDGWRYMFGFSILLAFFQGLGMTLMPSSPRFQMIRKEEEEARLTLIKFRGTEDVEEELCSISESLKLKEASSIFDLCQSKQKIGYRFAMGLGIVFFQQFTGEPSVLFYAPTIFMTLGFSSDAAAMAATVGLGIVKVFFTAVALLYVDRVGSRKFLLTGTLMMFVGITSLGLVGLCIQHPSTLSDTCQISQSNSHHLYNTSSVSNVVDTSYNVINGSLGTDISTMQVAAHVKWISFLGLVSYVAGYALGFGPMSWLLLSEIFPSQLRGRAISMSTVANWGTNLIVSSTFFDLMNILSLPGTMLLYAAMCAGALIYIFLLVPETKGLTLEEITSKMSQRCLVVDIGHCTRRRKSQLRLHATGNDCC